MTPAELKLVDPETGELLAPGCPECHDKATKIAGLENDVTGIAKQLAKAIRERDAKQQQIEERQRKDPLYPHAWELFTLWQVECNHPNAEFGPDRIRLALAALKLYKTPEKREMLKWAILGAKHCAYRDPKGKVHDSFGLIFRGSEQIEDFTNRYARWKRANPC